MDILCLAFARGLLYGLLCLPALGRAGGRRYLLAGGLLAVAFSPYGLTVLWHLLTRQSAAPTYLNWTGQGLLVLVSLAAMTLLVSQAGWSWAEFGFRLSFKPGTGRAVLRYLLPLLLLELGGLAALVLGGPVSAEFLLFQFSAPGLSEELLFRGVLLALLDRAFPGRVRVLGASLGWGAVVSSLLFGLAHGLHVGADYHLSLQLAPVVIPLVGGFVLAWCRARSGSLLLPMAVHSGLNGLAQVIVLLKAGC